MMERKKRKMRFSLIDAILLLVVIGLYVLHKNNEPW